MRVYAGALFQEVLEKDVDFRGASCSLCAQVGDKPLIDYQSFKSLLPNSIIKLLTTATCLKQLKESFSYTTVLQVCGEIKEGILKGDLVLIGSGDPSLESELYPEAKTLTRWAQGVKALGVDSIQGDILVDVSCFDTIAFPPSWGLDDVGNYYGAGTFGVNFRDNCYPLEFKLGSYAGEATTLIEPKIKGMQHINEVTMDAVGTGDRAHVFEGERENLRYIRGTLPLGYSTYTIQASLPNPPQAFGEALQEALQKENITCSNGVRIVSGLYQKKAVLQSFFHKSPPLIELVKKIHQKSINLYAECLLKTLGLGSREGGLKVVKAYLEELHVDVRGWRLFDGGGLSYKNLVTTKGFTSFLAALQKESYFEAFLRSLEQKAPYPLFVKTGTSSEGKSLAGYLVNKKGERVVFCLMVNRFLGPSQKLKEWMQDVLDYLHSAE